jgi:methyl-accepting chemotaxis protein
MFTQRSKKSDLAKSLATDALLTANVMVSDADLNIVYMNAAVIALLKEAESDLRP